jgi:hypothetical protein
VCPAGAGAELSEQLGVVAQLLRLRVRLPEASDARGRLGRRTRQVVTAAPRVGVEVQKALVLLLQRAKQCEQHHVLVHVREVAGVEAMAVLHDVANYGTYILESHE